MKRSPTPATCPRLLGGVCLLSLLLVFGRAPGVEIDSIMHQDPPILPVRRIPVLLPGMKSLWRQSLARPEIALKRQAATTILLAHAHGIQDLEDLADPLMEVLKEPEQDPVVVRAAAAALIELDARQAAPLLQERALGGGLDLAQLIEPALARWSYAPMRQVWLDRLAGEERSPRRAILAIRGLADAQESRAASSLLRLAIDRRQAVNVRLEAARGLRSVASQDLQPRAAALLGGSPNTPLVDRLVAATLLASQRGQEVEKLLTELTLDGEPAVSAIALERLIELDPSLVHPLATELISSDDAKVRGLVAQALAARPSPKTIALLGPMLDDPAPRVRRQVQESLVQLGQRPALRESVLDQAGRALAGERWRALEQAILLTAALEDREKAPRFVELLEFPRAEVLVTAAWGLRRLAVPATRDAMSDKMRRETERALAGSPQPEGTQDQLAQLIQGLVQMKHPSLAPVLRKYIPKGPPFSGEARAAAIWGLGHLYANNPQPDLTKALARRLSDESEEDPEDPIVRTMAAVTLGRMKAAKAMNVLRDYHHDSEPWGYASAWAVHQITGGPAPEALTDEVSPPIEWFLRPLSP